MDRHADDLVYTVAASVRDREGRISTGLNVFPFTGGPCAELAALGAARSGGAREVRTIVAVGHRDRGVLAPCGRRRQVLVDLHPPSRSSSRPARTSGASPPPDLLPFRYTPRGA